MNYKEYLDYVRVTKSANTLESYQHALDYFPQGNTEDVIEILKDERLADSTKELRLRIFKSAMKFYNAWTKALALLVDGWHGNENVQPCPSREEVEQIFLAAKLPHHRLALMLMAFNGLRVGEVASLNVEHVDEVHKRLILKQTKGKRDAYMPIASAEEWALIMELCKRKQAGDSLVGLKLGTLKNLVHRLAKSQGLDYHAHSLRRYFANNLKKKDVHIEDIQTLMRHKSIMTTRRYLNIDEEDSREILKEVC